MNDKYLQIRIFPSGKITIVKCKKDYIDYTGGDLYSIYNGNRKKPISYDYFVTTENRFEKDCKKHLGKMLRKIEKEYDLLYKKHNLINNIILKIHGYDDGSRRIN
jgi:hypothetical protein